MFSGNQWMIFIKNKLTHNIKKGYFILVSPYTFGSRLCWFDP